MTGSANIIGGVGLLILGSLATAGYAWLTGRKSVAFSELETALEFFKGEAAESRELRVENRRLNERVDELSKELSDVRTVALALRRKVDELETKVGDCGP